jgi:CheY-like chemotaxis protein
MVRSTSRLAWVTRIAGETMNQPIGQAPRILVVDDDAAIREFLRDLLGSEGYEVEEAANGLEAVERVRTNPPSAVLMDLMMPVLSGAEATSKLKSDPTTAAVPILAMSAGRNLATMANGVPADGFVSKPFDLSRLVEVLARHARPANGAGSQS